MSPLYYRIHGTFDGDFNLVVGPFWLQTPNLMYTNTTCNHVYCEQCALNITLFAKLKLKCPPMCVTSQFTKLVRQIYCTHYLNIYVVPLYGFFCL